jgi:hypothetical protein
MRKKESQGAFLKQTKITPRPEPERRLHGIDVIISSIISRILGVFNVNKPSPIRHDQYITPTTGY